MMKQVDEDFTSDLRNAAGGLKAKRSTRTKPLKMIMSCSKGTAYFLEYLTSISNGDVAVSFNT